MIREPVCVSIDIVVWAYHKSVGHYSSLDCSGGVAFHLYKKISLYNGLYNIMDFQVKFTWERSSIPHPNSKHLALAFLESSTIMTVLWIKLDVILRGKWNLDHFPNGSKVLIQVQTKRHEGFVFSRHVGLVKMKPQYKWLFTPYIPPLNCKYN